MKKTNQILRLILLLTAGMFIAPLPGFSQNFHSNVNSARDCYYIIYFDKDWKPLSIREGQILSGGTYRWIGTNEPAFQHFFCDFDTAFYYRFIYLKKLEAKNYVYRQQTTVTENKRMSDYYTLYVKGKGQVASLSMQFEAQRCTYLGLNKNGYDSLQTEGTRIWLDENEICTRQDYYRTYKNYELISNVHLHDDDCDKQFRGYTYSWRKDGKEILLVYNSRMQKAVFLRRPDSEICLAAYFIIKNNYTTYQPTIHWVVGDFDYLTDRYFGGDPVQSSGNSDETGDYLKSYWRDYPGTLFFPFHYTSDWNSLSPDVSKWFKLAEIDKNLWKQQWNDPSTNKSIGVIATEMSREYLNNGGYWSARYSKSGLDCNTFFYEEIY